MNGNDITAGSILLGWYQNQAVTLDRGAIPGSLTAYNLEVADTTFNLLKTDSVTNFYLSNSTTTLGSGVAVSGLYLQGGSMATTTAAGSVTGNVSVTGGSVLNLGANLGITGSLDVENTGSVVNAHGFGITAPSLLLGYYDTGAVTLTNAGLVNLKNLSMGHGSTLTLHGGDVVSNLISLNGYSVLTVQQTGGIGLTLNGTSSGSLTIDPSSMDVIFTSTALDNWDFRWKDPSSSSNWISTIDSMIHDGQIVLTLLPGQSYQVADSGGYTYIYGIGGASVPEPSSLALFCMGTLGVIVAARWKRKCGDC